MLYLDTHYYSLNFGCYLSQECGMRRHKTHHKDNIRCECWCHNNERGKRLEMLQYRIKVRHYFQIKNSIEKKKNTIKRLEKSIKNLEIKKLKNIDYCKKHNFAEETDISWHRIDKEPHMI